MAKQRWADTPGYVHDFLAICSKGHKRNFIWLDDLDTPLETVTDNCAICQRSRKFLIKNYWNPIVKDTQ